MKSLHSEHGLKLLRLVVTAALLYGLTLQGVLVERLHAGWNRAVFGEICASTNTQSGDTSDFSPHTADCLGLCTQSLMVAAPPTPEMFPFPDANMFRQVVRRQDMTSRATPLMGFQARGPPHSG